MTDAVLPGPGARPAPSRLRLPFSLRGLGAVLAALALATAGVAYILSAKAAVGTDDAYVQADKTVVAPKVRGLVAEVLVRDNQAVKAGEPLIRLDPEEYDARVAGAAADLQSAHAAVDAAEAALVSHAAEDALAQSNIVEAATAIRAADAQAQRAVADQARYDRLADTGFVARRDVEQVRATAASAQSDADRSRAALEVSRNNAALVRSHAAGLIAAVEQAKAAEARAKAALDLARQDQTNSVIRAPIDGLVGARQAQAGDYVQPGTRLMTLVPMSGLYVVANFKETQTARMRAGDPAEVRVDAAPGQVLHGAVESFAPGSGSEFSLLPYEPGTGNFTKIVQRVGVRIRIPADEAVAARLRTGLSADVKVWLQR